MIVIGIVAFLMMLVIMVSVSIICITVASAIYTEIVKAEKKSLEDKEIDRIITIGFCAGLILTILIFI